MDGDIVGLVLYSRDTKFGFGLEKANKKVSNCGSETPQVEKNNLGAQRHCNIPVFIYRFSRRNVS